MTEVSGHKEGFPYLSVVARNRAGLSGPESDPVSYPKGGRRVIKPDRIITSPTSDLNITTDDSVKFAGHGKEPHSPGAENSILPPCCGLVC